MLRSTLVFCVFLLPFATGAAETELLGHTKLRAVGQSYPDDSLFRELVGADALDVSGDLRLNFSASMNRWSFDAAYQLIGASGDNVRLGRTAPPGSFVSFTSLPDDKRRWFDLTDIISESSDSVLLQRLDRLWVGYTSEKTVVRFGRQALSWGNGLFFAPMDLVNPFDPATIDTEYKAGDDMLYLQYLRDSGDDLQAAYVVRRNLLTNEVDADDATAAVKYHGFAGRGEYDLLVARDYDDAVLGIGGSRSIGGAVWRADVVATRADDETTWQFVTNLSYSWTWGGRNMSGAIEYYFDGFGQHAGDYDPASLANNPALIERLVRGETFNLGRQYLAGSVLIEMTPLWTVTPTALVNLADPSALLQLVTNYSLSDNMVLLASLNLPVGPNGSEYGGIDTGIPGLYLASGPGLFAQFAWYF